MDGKVPRWLAIILILFGTTILGVSVYLERAHLALLQEHPIMVNLLSGMIGFGYSVVLVAFVINGVIRRTRIRSRRPRLYSMRSKAQSIHKELGWSIPADIHTRLHRDDLASISPVRTSTGGRTARKEIDLAEIEQGTRLFLTEAGKFLERATQVFELLVVPDEDIANQLTHVSDNLEDLRPFCQLTGAPRGDWRSKPHHDDSDIRQIVITYSLTVGAINKLWGLMFANPEIRRAGKPRGFSGPTLTA